MAQLFFYLLHKLNTMSLSSNKSLPAGWIGGFAQSNPKFAYPDPDLNSLPMLGNMDNISLLTRQQPVKWPEFSWNTEPGKADPKRCFQMFAPYISRLGYNNKGRVYSIICPQQGVWIADKICLNVEVTVTGQRGWVDENTKELAADMTVEGQIWFSPNQGIIGQLIWALMEKSHHKFPLTKAQAIKVSTHKPGNPEQPIFPVRKGEATGFKSPDFARHEDEAWTVGNVEVEIGPIQETDDEVVNRFNHLVMNIFNVASGNMLSPGNVLSWNVWFSEPKLVNQEAWRTHAERWRKSIDTHHGSPHGAGTIPRYFDGTPFSAFKAELQQSKNELMEFVKTHFSEAIEFLK